mgnify:CR=1 FL=1
MRSLSPHDTRATVFQGLGLLKRLNEQQKTLQELMKV